MSHAACPHCGHSIAITDFLAGQIVSCPACGRRFEVPAGSATTTPTPPPVVSGERSEPRIRASERTNPAARGGRPTAISLTFIVAGGVVGIGLAVLILLFVFNIDVLGVQGESRRATAQSNARKSKPRVNRERAEPPAKDSSKDKAPTAKVVPVPNAGQSTLLPPALSPVGPDGAIANDEFHLGDPPPIFPDPPPLPDPRDFGPNPPPPSFPGGDNPGGIFGGSKISADGINAARAGRGMAPGMDLGIGAFPDAGGDTAPIDEAEAAKLIGPLMEALEKGELPEERARAADELGQLGKHASKAVPFLVKSLKDVSADVRANSVTALRHIGPDAKVSIPELAKFLNSETNEQTRGNVVRALIAIDPKSKEVRTVLTTILISGSGTKPKPTEDWRVNENRVFACNAIAHIGPDAEWAIPLLKDLLSVSGQKLDSASNGDVFRASSEALGRIGKKDSSLIATLTKYREGAGLRSSSRVEISRAIEAVDTALRRIENTAKDEDPAE